MSEEVRTWVEVTFNLSYLAVIWWIVARMWLRRGEIAAEHRPLVQRILLAFALLALGDSGHVGFRVIATFSGGLSANPILVGAGALATAVTVTFFYMLMVEVWRIRFKRSLGWFAWSLLAAGLIRIVVMALPQNGWTLPTAPYAWSLLRNAFLVYQGIGVMALFFIAAAAVKDRPFTVIAWMIALSYLFYAPVILWAAQLPLLGMLMIPKTCAYVAVAVLAYRVFYPQKTAPLMAATPKRLP